MVDKFESLIEFTWDSAYCRVCGEPVPDGRLYIASTTNRPWAISVGRCCLERDDVIPFVGEHEDWPDSTLTDCPEHFFCEGLANAHHVLFALSKNIDEDTLQPALDLLVRYAREGEGLPKEPCDGFCPGVGRWFGNEQVAQDGDSGG